MEKNILTAYGNAFKHYFKFSGRSSRYDFWAFRVMDFAVMFCLALIVQIDPKLGIITGLYTLISLIPAWALLSRRLHDVNKSFWLFFWGWLPALLVAVANAVLNYAGYASLSWLTLIAGLWVLVMMIYILFHICHRGAAEENKYGSKPEEDEKFDRRGKWLMIFYLGLVVISIVANVVLQFSSTATY